jgi:hypothetical protein
VAVLAAEQNLIHKLPVSFLVLLLNRKNGEIRETNEDCIPKVFQRRFASLGLNPQGQKYSETPSVAGLQGLQIAQG